VCVKPPDGKILKISEQVTSVKISDLVKIVCNSNRVQPSQSGDSLSVSHPIKRILHNDLHQIDKTMDKVVKNLCKQAARLHQWFSILTYMGSKP